MKKLSLDIGDVWVGSALSDGIGITCKPFQTVKFEKLEKFIFDLLSSERIDTVIVGHPVTVGGKASAQTRHIEEIFANLKERFCMVNDRSIEWLLWDERFSTKRALKTMRGSKKETEKQKEHSIAAAFILQSYLDYKVYHAV